MAEDVIEFGSAPAAPAPRQRRRIGLPPVLMAPAAVLSGAGFFAIVFSWVAPWQTTALPDGPTSSREISVSLAGAGPTGAAYVVIAVAALAAVVVTLFGQASVRNTARLIGLALAGCGVALVLTVGLSLARTSVLADFRLFPQEDLTEVVFTVEMGVYLAAAGLAALMAALVLTIRPQVTIPVDARQEQAYADEPMELEVAVYPATSKAGPGPQHEIFQRP